MGSNESYLYHCTQELSGRYHLRSPPLVFECRNFFRKDEDPRAPYAAGHIATAAFMASGGDANSLRLHAIS